MRVSGNICWMAGCIALAACLALPAGNPSAAAAGVVRGQAIEEAIRAYVAKNIFQTGRDTRIDFPGGISDVTLDGEDITWQVQSRRNEDFFGNTSFSIRFYEDGRLLDEKIIKARLEVLMHVVVSARSLGRNTVLSPDDVRVMARWFTRPPRNVVSSLDGVVGKKLRTGVSPNTEISRNRLEEVPAVKKGRPVKIVVDNGLMGITTIGISEQDGMHGELVKVKNASSHKTIYARVVDNSLVKVEF